MATIEEYKAAYDAARARGDAAGMQSANEGANALRAASGEAAQYATQDIANTRAQPTSVGAVRTYSDTQNDIKSQMATNSQLWHTADAATRSSLEQQNKTLASQLGTGVTFNPTAGTWSGSSDYAVDQLPTTLDYSSYINELYAAKQEAALAALESAYKNNVADLNASQAKIAPTYQASRNQTAATSEQQKRNFAEYAAANGLNSGASGQAELARGVTLQNNMNTLNKSEADAQANIELQRTKLANEYNSAIASAKADGNYELANALYQEKVRVDESLASRASNQANLNYQAYTANYNAQQDAQTRADTLANTEYDRKMAIAQQLAQYGDFSGYDALGIDTTQMRAAYQAAQAAAAASSSSSGSSSKSSGSSSSRGTGLTLAQAKALVKDGVFTDAAIQTLHANGYTDENIYNLNTDYVFDTGGSGATGTASSSDGYAKAVAELSRIEDSGSEATVPSRALAIIKQYYSSGRITEAQARKLAAQYGISI